MTSLNIPPTPSNLIPQQITEHFSIDEVTITQDRTVDNSLPNSLYPAVLHTAQQMEKIRVILGKPILVSSWFRCHALNFRVGSSSKSAHPKGEAVDFMSPGYSALQICKKILGADPKISFDQLILEHSWVHIAFNFDPLKPNRNQVLSLLSNGTFSLGLTDKRGVAYK